MEAEPSNFWQYVNFKRKHFDFLSTMKVGNKESSDSVKICDMFANFFRKLIDTNASTEWKEIRKKYIDDLKVSHSTSPENVSASFIKICKLFIIRPLTFIFNQSLCSGYFPASWNSSYINLEIKEVYRVTQSHFRYQHCSKVL